ncbi:MAG TPA: sugar ABC transporter permease [Chloroflexota bacterium]|jgi:multiple sugar transport system permease protein|nr:sugar ABC transporter permease [Chloroflexota bacterium]
MVSQPARRGNGERRLRLNRGLPVFMLAPAVVVLAALTLFPISYVAYLSLTDLSANTPDGAFIGLANYQLIGSDPAFWDSLRVTGLFTTAAVALEFLLGFGIALLLNRRLRGLGVVRTLLLLPMVMTPVIVGLTWRMLYSPTYGILDYLLAQVGLAQPGWLDDGHLALWSVVAVDVWQWTPFMFLLLTAGLHSLPTEPYEAARVDGASWYASFRLLTLPLMRNIIIIALIFRAIDAFDTFDIIWVLTNGGPGTTTQTLTIYSYFQSFRWFNFSYGAALSVVMLLIVAVFCIVMAALMRREPV